LEHAFGLPGPKRQEIEDGCASTLSYNLFERERPELCARTATMTSDKKAQANRRNPLKSTGPKTPEGKAGVRLNALRHGLLSKESLLPGKTRKP